MTNIGGVKDVITMQELFAVIVWTWIIASLLLSAIWALASLWVKDIHPWWAGKLLARETEFELAQRAARHGK